MVFNDPENKQGIIQHIDFLLFGTSEEFHDAYSLEDRVRNCNMAYDEAVVELLKADPNWTWDDNNYDTSLPVAYLDTTGGQDHYSVKDSFITILEVRVKDRNGDYKQIDTCLRRNVEDLDEKGEPERYYKIGNTIFLHPIPDYGYERGLEVRFDRGGEYFTKEDLDKEPGFAGIFHEYLPIVASLKWATSNGMKDKITVLSDQKQMMENKIQRHYEDRSRDEKPSLSVKRRNLKHTGL